MKALNRRPSPQNPIKEIGYYSQEPPNINNSEQDFLNGQNNLKSVPIQTITDASFNRFEFPQLQNDEKSKSYVVPENKISHQNQDLESNSKNDNNNSNPLLFPETISSLNKEQCIELFEVNTTHIDYCLSLLKRKYLISSLNLKKPDHHKKI